ncbi:hypothetical protein BJX63DRAFT_417330 [Aspergillus granulosus]|uniref:GPI anchored protein n=1 Tax=Aspergillus granulosus TaxID=176169 RepID=A0ABR4I5K0_9EURO
MSLSFSLSAMLLLLAHSALAAQSTEAPRLEILPAQPGHGINTTLAIPRDVNSAFSPLAKRQYNCPSNCQSCCQDLVCVNSLEDVCCGGYFCNAGETCANTYGRCCLEGTKACHDGCIPNDAECCESYGFCDPGEHCYIIGNTRPACSTTTEYTTSTYVDWEYFYYTITWTYWVTFYTYYIPSSTEIRTSTTTITTEIVSVYATDSAEASSSFDEISATLTYTPPSTATDPPTPTPTPPETGTSGLDTSDSDNLGSDQFESGHGSGGMVVQSPLNASWYSLVVFIGMTIMPSVLVLCL